MTTPAAPQQPVQQHVVPFDTGNQLLAEQPSQLTTALVDTPSGQRMAVTVRTPSTTVTVFLAGPDAKAWGTRLTDDAAKMSAAGLIAAAGGLIPGAPGRPA